MAENEYTTLNNMRQTYDSDSILSVYGKANPDQKRILDKIRSRYDSDTALDMLMKSLVKPAAQGMGEVRQAETRMIGVPILEEVDPWQKRVDTGMRNVERATTAYTEYVKKPLTKLGQKERAVIDKGTAELRKGLGRVPDVSEARQLIESDNWRGIKEMALKGRFPNVDELGEDYLTEQLRRVGAKYKGTQRNAILNIVGFATGDPDASWYRRGEVRGGEISSGFVAKHPVLSILPLVADAIPDYVGEVATHPEQWPGMALWYVAGRFIMTPALSKLASTKVGQYDLTKSLKPLTDVIKTSKKPLSMQQIRNIVSGIDDPAITPEIKQAWAKLPDQEARHIVRMAARGADVQLIVPRRGFGGETKITLPSETVKYPVTPELRTPEPALYFESVYPKALEGAPVETTTIAAKGTPPQGVTPTETPVALKEMQPNLTPDQLRQITGGVAPEMEAIVGKGGMPQAPIETVRPSNLAPPAEQPIAVEQPAPIPPEMQAEQPEIPPETPVTQPEMPVEQQTPEIPSEIPPEATEEEKRQQMLSMSQDDWVHRLLPKDLQQLYKHPARGNLATATPAAAENYVKRIVAAVKKYAPDDSELLQQAQSIDPDSDTSAEMVLSLLHRYAQSHAEIGQAYGEHEQAVRWATRKGEPVSEAARSSYEREAEPAVAPTPETQAEIPAEVPTTPEPKLNAAIEPTGHPIQQVSADEMVVKPDVMQFKTIEEAETGINKEDKLQGQWDDLKGGVMLLWEPENPTQYGLKEGQKYIVANGHHRLEFGKRVGQDTFNAQVLSEADGYSIGDARSIAAEVNITEGRGSIYDQVAFLREQARTHGSNAAVERARSMGVKGRQAATIAFKAKDSLYSAFINEVISPEQTEVIANTARDDAEQGFGIKQAVRGLQGNVLAHMMKASQLEKAQAAEAGVELDLFGQDDTAIQKMEQKAKIASEYQKQIREQIRAVQGAAKRPDLARRLGVNVDDPMGVVNRIEQLKYELQKWENWPTHPELVTQVNNKLNEVSKTSYKQDAFDLVVPPRTEVDQIVEKNINIQRDIEKKQSEAGYARLRQRQAESSLREDSKAVTGSEDFADSMLAYRNSNRLYQRIKDKALRVRRGLSDLWHVEANYNITRAIKKGTYSANENAMMRQVKDDFLTKLQTVGKQGQELGSRYAYSLWGNLGKDEKEALANLIYLADQRARAKVGQDTMNGLSYDQLYDIFTRQYNKAVPDVRDSFNRYDEFQKAFVVEKLIKRDKIDANNMFEFYAPHRVMKYLWEGADLPSWNIPAPLKPRFRGYTKEAVGSVEDIAVGLDVIEDYWQNVEADNRLDDNAVAILRRADGVSRAEIISQMGVDGAKGLFAGLTPNQHFYVGSKKYVAMQYEQGRYIYQTDAVDAKLLAEALRDVAMTSPERIDAILNMPDGQAYEALMDYLQDVGPQGGAAIRKVLALGKPKPMYVVPEEIYYTMSNIRTKNFYIPLMRDAQELTSLFKGFALNWAALPYHMFQMFYVDGPNFIMTAPNAIKHIPHAWKVITNVKNLVANPNALGPDIAETFNAAIDLGVFNSGFLREYTTKGMTILHPIKAIEEIGGRREVWARVAMLKYQLDRVKSGKPVEAFWMEDKLKDLTPYQQAGYIARNFTVDFEDLPPFYRRVFRGFLFPFITGTQKGAQIVFKEVTRMPYKRPLRFLVLMAAPIAAIQAWNNTGWRQKIQHKLGWPGSRLYTIPVSYDEDTGDSWIWSPRTGIDEAGEWIGFDKFMQKVHKLRMLQETGALTKKDIEDAAKQQLFDTTTAPLEKINELATPMAQAIEGVLMNRDPFTRQPILPDPSLQGTPESAKYYIPYVISKIATPIQQLATQRQRTKVKEVYPEYLPKPLSYLLGIAAKGPADIRRAFGFYKININDVRSGEIQRIQSSLANKEQVYRDRIVNEFISNTPLDYNTAFSQFSTEVIDQVSKIQSGNYDLTTLGNIILDSMKDNIELGGYIFGGSNEPGSLMNRLYAPKTWIDKMAIALNQGRDPGTGRPLTAEQKEYIGKVKGNLRDIYLMQDLERSRKGIEPELLRQVLPLYGITAEEYFQRGNE